MDLVIKVSVLGIIFTSALNTTTEAGILTQNIKPIYDTFNIIATKLIINKEIGKTTNFWTEVEQELNQINLKNLTYLENYFSLNNSLSPQKRDDYKTKINNIKKLQNQNEQIKTIITYLKEIMPKDLPEMLKNLNVEEEFLKRYFPKKYPK